ncbi:histone-lysine N-methyltransferase, H3 lysine-9 specific SUVH4-like [Typha angustifolia]|uniref:histone-lysine N-methyltransferase, H3 lysine-9 specific SUVH4-like n=1 Tax=Typha angustifolia TaxID=59011 RepID=UPI003C2E9815
MARVKFNPRKVSAIRTWPKGCGRFPPLAEVSMGLELDSIKIPESDGKIPPSQCPVASPRAPKQEAKMELDRSVTMESLESEKTTEESLSWDFVVSNGSLEHGGSESKHSEVVREGSSDLAANGLGCSGVEIKLQEEVAVKVEALDGEFGGVGVGKRWLISKVYPPPKRRVVSAVRHFPVGCGRSAPPLPMSSEVCLPIVAVDDGKKSETDQQLNTEISGKFSLVKKPESKRFGYKESEEDQQPTVEASGEVALVKKPESKCYDSNKEPEADRPLSSVASAKDVSAEKFEDEKLGRDKIPETNHYPEAESLDGTTLPSEMVKTKSLDGEKKFEAHQHLLVEGSGKASSTEMAKNKRMDHEKKLGLQQRLLVGGLRKAVSLEKVRNKNLIDKVNSVVPYQPGAKVPLTGNIVGKVKENIGTKKLEKSIKCKLPEEVQRKGHAVLDQSKEDASSDSHNDRVIVQAMMAAARCPWRQGKRSAAKTSRPTPLKSKLKKERKILNKSLALKVSSDSVPINEVKVEDGEDAMLEDNVNEKALTIYQGKHELSVNITPCVPPGWNSKGSDSKHVDARSRVRRILRLFQLVCRKLLQGEEAKSKESGKIGRVDLDAVAILKRCNDYVNHREIFGNVPGVEVGDEFHYRVELSIVGLHRPFQGGIDSAVKNGIRLATSIVASGGYPDDVDASDVLIYSGAGGKPSGKKLPEDQKLERGNLALKNSIDAQIPVRVIHGLKELKGSDSLDARPKMVSTFTYDGLYLVEKYWSEIGPHGTSVFKFQLRRMPGQPELALHIVKKSKKSKVREGLCLSDISQGKERIPICAINTIDDERPPAFKYITRIIYPPWYVKTRPKGCDCSGGCSDSSKCACAVKNGGEIPFNFNGAIVQAKPLIYECGPSCKCPPSCHNRVSQRGIKIPLEIFKTSSRGWGVRSLSSIPSGSFICEYVGELLQDKEAEKRSNDEYLFDIGHNYDDQSLWEGLPTLIPDLQSSSCSEVVEDQGFTIDAAECGNVGRFINHSCSPNLYAQNVLYDHDDKRMPHIMFFAAENIPKLQELTYHYNYMIDQVHDSEGNIKRKDCYCGSSECSGRLY